jgi:hypothetical protein
VIPAAGVFLFRFQEKPMTRGVAPAFVAAMALSCPAFAQDAEIAKIRDEIRQMKASYERRIETLERRLAEAEAKAAAPAQAAAPERAAAPAAGPARSGNAFNPAISLILQGTYAHTSKDPDTYAITGFMPSGGEVGPPKRNFGLAETELVFSGSVDPYFSAMVVAAVTPENEVEAEEAFFQTSALPLGLTLKGGRFLSAIGYQNELHQHAWDFQDAPLPYKAFLGGRLRQDGVQLKWLAPTPLFVELGAEASSGDQFPGSERNKNGIGGGTLFGHVGGDLGASTSWRAGLSYVRASPRGRSYEDLDSLGGAVTNSFSGKARVWVADAVLKWAPDGNATRTNFKLQGEYFRFRQDGRLSYDDSGGSAVFGSQTGDFESRQSGWYLQGVWQFMPRWRVGYRYDRLDSGSVDNAIVASGAGPSSADFGLLAPHDPSRNTLMLDWSPTEFSRVRLQFARDRSRLGETDHQVLLQYIQSLGAHGAHRF